MPGGMRLAGSPPLTSPWLWFRVRGATGPLRGARCNLGCHPLTCELDPFDQTGGRLEGPRLIEASRQPTASDHAVASL